MPLVFVEKLPPADKGRHPGPRTATLDRVAELHAHPGEWATWPTRSPASQVGRILARIGPGFEVVRRHGRVYVRWCPPK